MKNESTHHLHFTHSWQPKPKNSKTLKKANFESNSIEQNIANENTPKNITSFVPNLKYDGK